MGSGAELARTWELECEMQDRVARTRQEFDLGVALFNDALRRVYDANVVRFERGFEELSGERVEAAADELQASLRHRKVQIPDERAGARVAEELKGRGWRYYTLVTMAHRGDGTGDEAGSHAHPVEEVEARALRPARERSLDDGRRDPEARRQIVEFTELMARAVPTRLFAARADRHEVGSFCALFQRGGIAQIDEVTTVDQYRRRGLAAAVVGAAVRESKQAGDQLTFLVADESDWPKDWYARLGFEPIGRRYELLRI
jgi:ribosomal protein S18 acetylase RimI-like enzyme